MNNTNTIAAIATPRGTGGIAVIRISGTSAFEVGEKIFMIKNKKYKSFSDIPANTAVFGDIINCVGHGEPDVPPRIIDEGIIIKYKSPNSYTGEDTVEISCHGGIYITNAVLTAAINAGARLAQPGEFTKTAYINGKISLTGAEAVGRLIQAVNETGARVAHAQSKGGLSKKIYEISDKIKDIISEVYVFIDYPGEDLTDMTSEILPIFLDSPPFDCADATLAPVSLTAQISLPTASAPVRDIFPLIYAVFVNSPGWANLAPAFIAAVKTAFVI